MWNLDLGRNFRIFRLYAFVMIKSPHTTFIKRPIALLSGPIIWAISRHHVTQSVGRNINHYKSIGFGSIPIKIITKKVNFLPPKVNAHPFERRLAFVSHDNSDQFEGGLACALSDNPIFSLKVAGLVLSWIT